MESLTQEQLKHNNGEQCSPSKSRAVTRNVRLFDYDDDDDDDDDDDEDDNDDDETNKI